MTEELVEEGIVLDSGNGIVEIQLKENENCEECSAKLFCSTGNGNSKTLKINNNSNFEPGDKVTISISGKNLIIASLNLYFFPILILVISIFLGSKIFYTSEFQEIYSFLTGIGALSIYYMFFFQISKKLSSRSSNITLIKSE